MLKGFIHKKKKKRQNDGNLNDTTSRLSHQNNEDLVAKEEKVEINGVVRLMKRRLRSKRWGMLEVEAGWREARGRLEGCWRAGLTFSHTRGSSLQMKRGKQSMMRIPWYGLQQKSPFWSMSSSGFSLPGFRSLLGQRACHCHYYLGFRSLLLR
jgi:hypothetical protein